MAHRAYDALSPALRQRLEGRLGTYLIGHHRWDAAPPTEADLQAKAVSHRILSTHPETGRKALYLDPTKIMRIEGLGSTESDALIKELEGLMLTPDGQYRHKWSKGDIVIWDNRCSLHKAAGDYPPEEDRIHWRVSIKEGANSTFIPRAYVQRSPHPDLAPTQAPAAPRTRHSGD